MTGLSLRICCTFIAERHGRGAFFRSVEAPSEDYEPPAFAALPTMPAPDHRTPEIAVHEAAHAVAAILTGGTCNGISFEPTPHAQVHNTDPAGCAVVLLAGPVSDQWQRRTTVFTGPSEVNEREEALRKGTAGSCDRCRAVQIAAIAAPDGDTFGWFHQAEAEAIALVQKPSNWRAIRAVADVLMISGTLSGDAITAIIENAP